MSGYYALDSNGTLHQIEKTRAKEENILEKDYQKILIDNFHRVIKDCLIIDKEYCGWEGSQRRIDLLAIDKNANIVVIEIKRDERGGHMDLQSIRYAAHIDGMRMSAVCSTYQKFKKLPSLDDAKSELISFLGWDAFSDLEFIPKVRIIMISSDFDPEIIRTASWLNSKNIATDCIKFSPFRNSQDGSFIFEIAKIAIASNPFKVKSKKPIVQKTSLKTGTLDTTKYIFNGDRFGKNRLVLAVVKHYQFKNPNVNYKDLENAFPKKEVGRDVFKYKNIVTKAEIDGKRYFMKDSETLFLKDGSEVVVSTQWGAGNMKGRAGDIIPFIEHAQKVHGYDIQEDQSN